MKTALINALQELARVVLLAIVPVAITGVENGSVDWKVLGTVALLAVLRFVDKLLHEWGKVNDNKLMIKGLTQF